MNSLTRTSVRALTRPRTLLPAAPRRHYAAELPKSTNPQPSRGNGFSPVFLGVAAVFAFVPAYYFLHSDKSARSGRAAIEEHRAQDNYDATKEFRDPRDSGVKTIEQKKAKEAGKDIK
ncbi:uncharacterized protein AB675_1564 [Cyphellophora attinorum]|uniref:Uncharacterized protein n=1 Tax=Cyphellophora attinorum TaxID=1664694 RepID=A0A0N1NXE5_9EURO|nr:uncharacterized protein AB675_1564 [Phialophora attinorum]KPI37212.1 hypothetical protein AB675_1564 [Phialophora attinorum]